jgi:hypothetical protein
MAGTNLNAVNANLMPPQLTGPIFAKASEQSAVMNLARKVPLSVSATPRSPSRWTSPPPAGSLRAASSPPRRSASASS